MHWNNGMFHESITVKDVIYITDHKHIAITGTKDYTWYGESNIDSCMFGKNIGIVSENKLYSDSYTGSNLWSKQYIRIEAGSTTANHNSDSGKGIEIVSKNGALLLNGDGYATNVRSTNEVNITAGTHLNLHSNSGITINNVSYGTSLPASGTEGQIFFKLIS